MGSVPGRARRLESVISICLLVVLILTGVGVFVKQSDYDMSRFGIDATGLPRPETASEFGNIVPGGFETLSKAEFYTSENLYEKINGKAPLYLESGFEELSTQRFFNINDQSQWMELYIYDMGNIKNAFGVYSVQKRADSEAFASVKFAYKTANALYFVHGKYYVEIISSAESNELFKAIEEAAQKVQANLVVDNEIGIAELAFFPQENLVSDSIKLYLVNAFGFEGLTDTFTARYKFGDETNTAFLSQRANPKDAEAIAENYRSFLIENGAVVKNTENKLLEGKVMDLFGTTEIVFTTGPFVAGVHEAENQQTAERIAEMFIKKLNSLDNE